MYFLKKQRFNSSKAQKTRHTPINDEISKDLIDIIPALSPENKDDLGLSPIKSYNNLSPDLIIALNNIKKENSATLSCDEFDAFFNINFLSGNSRKLRRYRVLKSLPSNLFRRTKCTKDKRKFNYSINLSLLSQLI